MKVQIFWFLIAKVFPSLHSEKYNTQNFPLSGFIFSLKIHLSLYPQAWNSITDITILRPHTVIRVSCNWGDALVTYLYYFPKMYYLLYISCFLKVPISPKCRHTHKYVRIYSHNKGIKKFSNSTFAMQCWVIRRLNVFALTSWPLKTRHLGAVHKLR